MAYLNQPWFNREIINRFAMATGVVHSQTLTVISAPAGTCRRFRLPLSMSTA